MKHNTFTKLFGYSFNRIYNKNGLHTVPDRRTRFFPDFPGCFPDFPRRVMFHQCVQRFHSEVLSTTREHGNAFRIELAIGKPFPKHFKISIIMIPIKKRGNLGKIRLWGLEDLGAIFIASCIIILLYFGLVTFRIHFAKARKVISFMFVGPGGRVHNSQNQLFLILETPRYSKQSRKNKSSGKGVFLDISELRNSILLFFWKRRGPANLEGPSNISLKILNEYGINVFPKTRTGNLVMWDQYLSKNIKWTFGNMGAMSIKQHEFQIW